MRDYESDMASLCDFINTHCREHSVPEASDYTLSAMRMAIDRVVFKQQREIERMARENAGLLGQVKYWQRTYGAAQAEVVDLRDKTATKAVVEVTE